MDRRTFLAGSLAAGAAAAINYQNVFRHIHRKGYTGILGMEHGLSKGGVEGEQALIDAYVEVDGFDV
jgi:hypothetical protein